MILILKVRKKAIGYQDQNPIQLKAKNSSEKVPTKLTKKKYLIGIQQYKVVDWQKVMILQTTNHQNP
jgi:hypothetical protein